MFRKVFRLFFVCLIVINLTGCFGVTSDNEENKYDVKSVDPALDPANNWDWKDNKFYNDNKILNPFGISNSVGISVINGECEKAEGWELYIRRITSEDYDGNLTKDSERYFVLYNKIIGIMRVFYYIKSDGKTEGDYATVKTTIVDAMDKEIATALFLNTNEQLYAVENKDNIKMENVYVTKEVKRGVWLVYDLKLGFNTTSLTGTYLKNIVYIHNESSMDMTGKFICKQFGLSINKNDGTTKKTVSDTNNAKGLKEASKKIIDTSKLIDSTVGNSDALKKGMESAGVSLGNLAGSLIGNVLSGNFALPSIFNIGGNMQYSYMQGSITLSGTIKDSVTTGIFKIPLGKNIATTKNRSGEMVVETDIPYYVKKNPSGKYGLYSMNKQPKLIINKTYSSPSIGNPIGGLNSISYNIDTGDDMLNDLFVVNAESGMEIEKISYECMFINSKKEGNSVGFKPQVYFYTPQSANIKYPDFGMFRVYILLRDKEEPENESKKIEIIQPIECKVVINEVTK